MTTVRSSTKFRQADSVGPSPHTSSLQAQTCTLPPSTHGVFRRPLRRWIYSAPVNLPNTNLPTGVSGPFVFVFSSAVSNVGGSPHYLGWPTKSGPQKVARSTANRSQVRALASLAASGNSPAFSLSRYLERRRPFTTAGGPGKLSVTYPPGGRVAEPVIALTSSLTVGPLKASMPRRWCRHTADQSSPTLPVASLRRPTPASGKVSATTEKDVG